jgi:sulfur relay protein TusB/DsrH
MTLHIPRNPEKEHLCRLSLSPDDCIILIADGTYCAQDWPTDSIHQVTALNEDAVIRGVTLHKDIDSTDYTGFVKLSAEHRNSLSWH